MGDLRFDAAYEAVASAPDRAQAIAQMSDTEVIHALAAASRRMDAYVANVLAVEALNRRHRQRALFWGIAIGLGLTIALRTTLFLAYFRDPRLTVIGLAAIPPSALVGYAVYHWLLHKRDDLG